MYKRQFSVRAEGTALHHKLPQGVVVDAGHLAYLFGHQAVGVPGEVKPCLLYTSHLLTWERIFDRSAPKDVIGLLPGGAELIAKELEKSAEIETCPLDSLRTNYTPVSYTHLDVSKRQE